MNVFLITIEEKFRNVDSKCFWENIQERMYNLSLWKNVSKRVLKQNTNGELFWSSKNVKYAKT